MSFQLRLFLLTATTTYIFQISLADNNIVYKDEVDLQIVGGNLSDLHQFPYQVGIFLHRRLDREFSFCGGSIISENYILTAARCFKVHNISTINILFGARNVSNWEPGYQYMTIRVYNTSVIVHENYDHEGHKNDIALVKLNKKLLFNDGIQAVGLPKTNVVSANKDYLGENGTIAGWGFYKEDEFGISPQLNYVIVSVMSNEKCRSYNSELEVNVDSNNLCTSGEGTRSLCQADYGGALVVNRTQIGIMSWYWDDLDDCFLSLPSVYAKVSAFRSWIYKNSGV